VATRPKPLVSSIFSDDIPGLISALRDRERRRLEVQARLTAMRAQQPPRSSEIGRLRNELLALAADWRHTLAGSPIHARPIVTQLLNGRVTFTPLERRHHWELRGQATLTGLFTRVICPPGWRPQRDSNPTDITFRRVFRAA
jgi:hypothetical protein